MGKRVRHWLPSSPVRSSLLLIPAPVSRTRIGVKPCALLHRVYSADARVQECNKVWRPDEFVRRECVSRLSCPGREAPINDAADRKS